MATNNFDEIVLLKRYQKMIDSNLPKSVRRHTPYLLGIYDNVNGKIVLMKVNLVSLNQDGTIKENDIDKILTKAQKKIITDKFPNLEGKG